MWNRLVAFILALLGRKKDAPLENADKDLTVSRFGRLSLAQLDTCHPDLQRLFYRVVEKYDCSVLVGNRSHADQDKAFNAVPQRSKVKWPNGKHNSLPSSAVDVAPYPVDWSNTKRFYHFAGYVQGIANELGIKIRWGGDWDSDYDLDDQKFMDLVHFELIKSETS